MTQKKVFYLTFSKIVGQFVGHLFFFDFFSILKNFNKMSVFRLGFLNIRFNSGANNNEQLILFLKMER